MSARSVSGVSCRRCAEAAIRIRGADRQSFWVPGAKAHYAPDLPLKLEHILLDLKVDPKGKDLSGTVTQTVSVVAPNQTWMKLDQIGLKIEDVKLRGKPARFEIEGDRLRVQLAESESQAPKPGERFDFSIRYSTHDPKRGIYFTGPDDAHPNKPYQVWTQGQDEDSRYWFPTFDYPNQKATSEVIATVPKGYTAVSNGALLNKKEEGAFTRFHYKFGTPHVTYLISLVVAEFSQWEDKGPNGLPVQYFVAPGREADGKRAFGETPKMIEAFERKIGVPYAYEKYSQAAVQDFIFGGMENTSSTTQTDRVLHDEKAHIDFRADSLVSHELAHQWFGDLITCRDWSNGWLNEGFATFMERVWVEENKEPGGGPDEAKYYQYLDLKDYLDEDGSKYRRPIVCNAYLEPIDLFDAHLYQKGGLVLNLIRATLGEELFWKSVRNYVVRHRGGSVETLDFIRAIEETTGRNLRRFFDEWVFGAGHPELEISYEWHEEKKLAEIVVEQKQTGGQPSVTKDGATTHLFHLSVPIELTLAGGKKIVQCVEIGEARDRIFLHAESKPLMVRFDPGANVPKTMKFPRPKEMLLYQLENDTDCMGRIEAAHELARDLSKFLQPDVVAALAKAAQSDKFWAVQAEAAAVLGEMQTPEARDALITALETRHSRARRGIAKALGRYRDERAAEALKKHALKDASYFVEAESVSAYASARVRPSTPSSAPEVASTEGFLLEQLSRESYTEVVRAAALRSLAVLPGVARGERPHATAALLEWARTEKPLDTRIAAIDSLGRIVRGANAAERARILEAFSAFADEPNFRVRMALAHALEETESPDAIPILAKIRKMDPDGRVRRTAMHAIDRLHTAGSTPESVSSLKTSLEKLEEEHRKLRSWVEELKAASAKT